MNKNTQVRWTAIDTESSEDNEDLESLKLELGSKHEIDEKEDEGRLTKASPDSQTSEKTEDKEDQSEGLENKTQGAKGEESARDDEVDTKPSRAYKRIKNLLARDQANKQVISELQTRVQTLEKSAKVSERKSIDASKEQWARQVELKTHALEKAVSDNDPKELAKATKELADAQMRFNAYEAFSEDAEEEQAAVESSKKQAEQPHVPEEAKNWIKRNPWFFKDEEKHVLARTISAKLSQENEFDPEDEEYWDELDKRLSKYNITSTNKDAAGPQRKAKGSPVGSSRSADEDSEQFVRSGNKITAYPSKGDVDMAERMGINLTDYMREKHKYASQNYKGYVTIDIP